MGIAFSLTGLVLIITGMQNTYGALGTQLEKDFTGTGSFVSWLTALCLVGALGYVPKLRTFSTWFMALIILAIFLSKGKGFFSQFQAAIQKGPVSPSQPQAQSSTSSTSTSSAPSNTSFIQGVLRQLGSVGNFLNFSTQGQQVPQ